MCAAFWIARSTVAAGLLCGVLSMRLGHCMQRGGMTLMNDPFERDRIWPNVPN